MAAIETTSGDKQAQSRSPRRYWILLVPAVPLLAIALAWHYGAFEGLDSAEQVATRARALRGDPAAPLYVIAGFGIGTLFFLPVTGLIVGTALAFDPWRGFAYALCGVLFAASTTYWFGRLLGGRVVDYLSGPRIARIKHELQTRAFRASIIARLLPVGNFTVINVLAGSLRVPFRAYFLGNIVGALPGVIVFALFAEKVEAAVRNPSAGNIALLVGAGLVVLFGMWWLRRAAQRRERREARAGLAS